MVIILILRRFSVRRNRRLLLHKQDFRKSVFRNDAYVTEVRKAYGLKKTDDIKQEKIIKDILSQITLEDVKTAIRRAEQIRELKLPEDGMKEGNSIYYKNYH